MLQTLNFTLSARQRDANAQPEKTADQPADSKTGSKKHGQQRRNTELTLREEIVERDHLVILRAQRH